MGLKLDLGVSPKKVHPLDAPIYRPNWNLRESSSLSTHQAALEFINHAFTPTTRDEMSRFNLRDFIRSLQISAAQGSCMLAEAANRLQEFVDKGGEDDAMKSELQKLKGENEELKKREAKLLSEVKDLKVQVARALGRVSQISTEKASLVKSLEESREFGHIQEEKVKVLMSELEGERNAKAFVEDEKDWLLKEGLLGVIDKLFENDLFIAGVKKLQAACEAKGEALGKSADGGEGDGVAKYQEAVDQALDQFVNVDYASILGLASADVPLLKALLSEGGDVEAGSSDPPVKDGEV